MNVLFLSAGRRVELIQCFKASREKLGINGSILAADANGLAPALYFADKQISLPYVKDENYKNALLEACQKEKVKLVIPTIDTELQALSDYKREFDGYGVNLLVSQKPFINICRNKISTYQFFKENHFNSPKTWWDLETIPRRYPLFIKPLDGSSSINAFVIKNDEELEFFIRYIPKPIVQEFITGEEYTIDVFCDFESYPIFITQRKRIATRSGEVLKTQIVRDDLLTREIERLIKVGKPIGPITVQVIKSSENGMYYFIEINPRFGGGAPLTIMAGADSPSALYRLMNGEKLEPSYEAARNSLYFLRFDQSISLIETGDSYEKN